MIIMEFRIVIIEKYDPSKNFDNFLFFIFYGDQNIR
jgi:hypothetical protein